MSLRAELVRLGLRWFLKPTNRPGVTITAAARADRQFPALGAAAAGRRRDARGALGGVPALHVATPPSRPDRHILFLHGGGYVTGSPDLYRHLLWRIAAAAAAGSRPCDYRLAPEHPFPAALDDALASWRGLLAAGAEPRRAVFIGDSAGGGLALASGAAGARLRANTCRRRSSRCRRGPTSR